MSTHSAGAAFSEGISSGNELDLSEKESFRKHKRRSSWGLNREYGGNVESDEEDEEWGCCRKRLHKFLRSTGADVILGGVIALSLAVVIAETDATADGEEPPELIQMMNIGFTVLYSFELIVRLYVYRLKFFCHWFNLMDFLIVFVDVILKLFQQSSIVSTLRIFRLLKLARVLVLLVKFPELHMILRGIYGTIKSIFWGMCLLTTVIIIWSILGVQLIHPLNKQIDHGDCERCGQAFSGVFNSFLTIFQTVVAGDSWGLLAVPIIEQYPLALAYFATVFVSISLLVLNLILATTVERAAAAKEEDEAELARRRMIEKAKAYKVAEKRLKILCKEMDADKSGSLTQEELQDGYMHNQEFRNYMKAMDIREDDMKTVFKLLDTDGSGDVHYEEFVESLHMMRTRDSHTLLMFTHHLVEDIVTKSAAQLKLLTSKSTDGLVNRISDEVASKLGSLIETSAKSAEPYELWPHETQDDEAQLASWSSTALPPEAAELLASADKRRSKPSTELQLEQKLEQKLEQTRVVASSLDVVPPIVPVTPLPEVTPRTASFAACCQRSAEANVNEPLDVDHKLKEAKYAGEPRDRKGRGASISGNSLLADLEVVPQQLTQITTAVERIERAIYFIGGAGKHSLWCPRCPPREKEVDGPALQEGKKQGST